MRYLNTRSGQHRQSSKLPESEGRIGRGGRRTEISVFPDSQIHTLTHQRHTHKHTLSDFCLISGRSSGTLPVTSSLPLTALLTFSPASTSTAPLAARADGHGVGLFRGCRRLCPVGPRLGEQRCGFRGGTAIELLSPFQPLLLPVYPPRGAGWSWGDRRWGRGASHPPNNRQPHRLHPWPGVPR